MVSPTSFGDGVQRTTTCIKGNSATDLKIRTGPRMQFENEVAGCHNGRFKFNALQGHERLLKGGGAR